MALALAAIDPKRGKMFPTQQRTQIRPQYGDGLQLVPGDDAQRLTPWP